MEPPNNGGDNVQPDIVYHQVKLSVSGWITSSWVAGQWVSMDSPKHHRPLAKLLVALHNLMVVPYCWKQHLHHQTRRIRSGVLRGASSLWTICLDPGSYSACYQRRKVINSINQLQTLWPTIATCMVQCLHKCYVWVTNSIFIGFKAHPLRWNSHLTLL